MNDKLKTYGVESYYKTPRIYINNSWIAFETETLIINDEIVAVSYLDKDTMPPNQTQYGDKNTYIDPEGLKVDQCVDLVLKTPGEECSRIDTKARYIGTKQAAMNCTVHAAKDPFDLTVLTVYFIILKNQ